MANQEITSSATDSPPNDISLTDLENLIEAEEELIERSQANYRTLNIVQAILSLGIFLAVIGLFIIQIWANWPWPSQSGNSTPVAEAPKSTEIPAKVTTETSSASVSATTETPAPTPTATITAPPTITFMSGITLDNTIPITVYPNITAPLVTADISLASGGAAACYDGENKKRAEKRLAEGEGHKLTCSVNEGGIWKFILTDESGYQLPETFSDYYANYFTFTQMLTVAKIALEVAATPDSQSTNFDNGFQYTLNLTNTTIFTSPISFTLSHEIDSGNTPTTTTLTLLDDSNMVFSYTEAMTSSIELTDTMRSLKVNLEWGESKATALTVSVYVDGHMIEKSPVVPAKK